MDHDDAKSVLRLVVPSPDGRRLLARPNGLAGWALPTVATANPMVWGAPLSAAAARVVGGAVVPVRRLGPTTWEVELVGRVPRAGNHWVGPSDARRLGADAGVVEAWEEAERSAGALAPHLRRGWWTDLDRWSSGLLEDRGPLELVRHWELGAVARAETAAGPVAIKWCPPSFDREPAIVAALAGCPGAPDVIVADGDRLVTRWHGDAGVADRIGVARRHGALQRAAASRLERLRDAGCIPVDDLLAEASPPVADALDALSDAVVPTSVLHGDAHAGNTVGVDPVIIDWSDAVIGPAAADLELLCGTGSTEDEALKAADAWAAGAGLDPAVVRDLLPSARLVGAAIALELHRRHRPRLPGSILEWWDEDEAWWAGRVAEHLA